MSALACTDDELRNAVHENAFDFPAAAKQLSAAGGADGAEIDGDAVRAAFADLALRERAELERLKKQQQQPGQPDRQTLEQQPAREPHQPSSPGPAAVVTSPGDIGSQPRETTLEGFDPEPSDFTIFTHCLKTRVAEIYTDVRSRLPVIGDDNDDDDDNDDNGDNGDNGNGNASNGNDGDGDDGMNNSAETNADGNPRGVPEIVKSRYWGTDQAEMDRVIASLLSGDLASIGAADPAASPASSAPISMGMFEGDADSDDDDNVNGGGDRAAASSAAGTGPAPHTTALAAADDDNAGDEWQFTEEEPHTAASLAAAASASGGGGGAGASMDPSSMAIFANMAQGLMQAMSSGQDPAAAIQALEQNFLAAVAGADGGAAAAAGGGMGNSAGASHTTAGAPALRIDDSLRGLDLDAMLDAVSQGHPPPPRSPNRAVHIEEVAEHAAEDANGAPVDGAMGAVAARGPALDGNGDVIQPNSPQKRSPPDSSRGYSNSPSAATTATAAAGTTTTAATTTTTATTTGGGGGGRNPRGPAGRGRGGGGRGGGRISSARGAVPQPSVPGQADSDDDSDSDDELIDRSRFKQQREREAARIADSER
jgi:hypothetical protein